MIFVALMGVSKCCSELVLTARVRVADPPRVLVLQRYGSGSHRLPRGTSTWADCAPRSSTSCSPGVTAGRSYCALKTPIRSVSVDHSHSRSVIGRRSIHTRLRPLGWKQGEVSRFSSLCLSAHVNLTRRFSFSLQTRAVRGATEQLVDTLRWSGIHIDEGMAHAANAAGRSALSPNSATTCQKFYAVQTTRS